MWWHIRLLHIGECECLRGCVLTRAIGLVVEGVIGGGVIGGGGCMWGSCK